MFRQIIVLKFFVSYENCAMHGNFPFHIPLSLSLKKTENKFKNKTPPQYPNASRNHKTALSGNKKYFKAMNLNASIINRLLILILMVTTIGKGCSDRSMIMSSCTLLLSVCTKIIRWLMLCILKFECIDLHLYAK